ncbi:hypothetical protein AK830_g7672 [Neonectria ditissima]|uniref:Solute carrier family 40 protein n=1 Tax=Neonectria ditissima TaxID=78410 RepID=A0A0P7AZ40_9HYPO|nr:hypothetical protein AK830_g7672 [Neonectria ditissima]
MYQPTDPMTPEATVADEESRLLPQHNPQQSPLPHNDYSTDDEASNSHDGGRWTLGNSTKRLYGSHFLSTCNSRIFEFGSVLYLASIFPGTLLPMSVYAMVRGAAAIVLSSLVGQYIDREDRLKVVRLSIVLQRAVVAASCIIFLILGRAQDASHALRAGLLVILVILACVEKLAAMMNLVSVERDWVVVVAKDDTAALRCEPPFSNDSGLLPLTSFCNPAMNSQMRRIDLVCKLFGPFFIGVIDGISTETAILVNLGMNCVSVVIEYVSIAKVYHQVPALQRPKSIPDLTPEHTQIASQTHGSRWRFITQSISKAGEDTASYFKHPVFMASFAGSLLYFTVLAFNGQMVTYLLATGYTPTQISVARTFSVIFEVLATWVGPWLMVKIGPVRAGLWFSSWQVGCLALGMSIFWKFADRPLLSTLGLVGGTMLSRVGLWGFDLSVQIIVQEEVEADIRGAFSAVEASWQNVFEMCSYTLTIVLSSPSQFKWPATISVGAVFCAWALYTRKSLMIRMGAVAGVRVVHYARDIFMVTWDLSVVQRRLRCHRTFGAGAVHVWFRVPETAAVLDGCVLCFSGPPWHRLGSVGSFGADSVVGVLTGVDNRIDVAVPKRPGLGTRAQAHPPPAIIQVSCVGSETRGRADDGGEEGVGGETHEQVSGRVSLSTQDWRIVAVSAKASGKNVSASLHHDVDLVEKDGEVGSWLVLCCTPPHPQAEYGLEDRGGCTIAARPGSRGVTACMVASALHKVASRVDTIAPRASSGTSGKGRKAGEKRVTPARWAALGVIGSPGALEAPP